MVLGFIGYYTSDFKEKRNGSVDGLLVKPQIVPYETALRALEAIGCKNSQYLLINTVTVPQGVFQNWLKHNGVLATTLDDKTNHHYGLELAVAGDNGLLIKEAQRLGLPTKKIEDIIRDSLRFGKTT